MSSFLVPCWTSQHQRLRYRTLIVNTPALIKRQPVINDKSYIFTPQECLLTLEKASNIPAVSYRCISARWVTIASVFGVRSTLRESVQTYDLKEASPWNFSLFVFSNAQPDTFVLFESKHGCIWQMDAAEFRRSEGWNCSRKVNILI